MSGGFGNVPWGGAWGANFKPQDPEGIPYSPTWDVFDLSGVRQEDDISRVLVFSEVSTLGSGSSFFTGSFNIASGGAYPASTATLIIDKAVGEGFTVQYDLRLKALPDDFSGVSMGHAVGDHVYLGVWSAQDYAAGFFLSKQGWAYTGELVLTPEGNVAPAQEVAMIPGSDAWVYEGKAYSIRIVCDSDAQLVYVYTRDMDVAASALILRAILVAKPTVALVSDTAMVSARGSSAASWVELYNYQLSSKRVMPDLPPVADAGQDQTIARCSIVRLDGSSSADPEGATLSYEWRLVEAPVSSSCVVACGDGRSGASSTGYTDTFYSDELLQEDHEDPVVAGDVLVVPSGAFTVTGVVRGATLALTVEYAQLPAGAVGVAFRVLRQRGVSGRESPHPTYYPDVPGFYVFDLRVFDGTTSSSPLGTERSRVLVNVLESPLPTGCPVDVSFIFNNLSSFWSLVEDKDKLVVAWEAIARAAATELYSLWQTEYSRSLRDIQRVAVRRWLHYDMLLPEPAPEAGVLRFVWGGFLSERLPLDGLSVPPGSSIMVASPFLSAPVHIPLGSSGDTSVETYAAELRARLLEVVGPSVDVSVVPLRPSVVFSGVTGLSYPLSVAGRGLDIAVDGVSASVVFSAVQSAQELVAEISAALPLASVSLSPEGDLRVGSKGSGVGHSVVVSLTSTALVAQGGALSAAHLAAYPEVQVHVRAGAPFTLTSASTAPGFSYPCVNGVLGGPRGCSLVGERTLRVGAPLSRAGLREDDLLVIGTGAYRVVRTLDHPDDDYAHQRVVVKEEVPATSDAEWVFPGYITSDYLNFWEGLVSRGDVATFEVLVPNDTGVGTSLAVAEVLGVNSALSGRLAVNTAQLAAQLSLDADAAVHLARVVRRRYCPIGEDIVDVPELAPVISGADPDEVLRRNVDYYVESIRGHRCLRFCVGDAGDPGDVWEGEAPPYRLWAEYTYVDNAAVIEANFGAAIGVTRDMLPESVDYLSAVRGIWYALYNGPTLRNLRVALQVFLGLPFAEERGTIEEVRTDYMTQKARLLVRDTANTELVRAYTYPRTLKLEENPTTGLPYKVGDTVEQFAPLVAGASVVDWVKDPLWFSGLLNQGIFYEVQKYHSFLVRVDSTAFSLSSLMFAQRFIQKIKPVWTDPRYIVGLRASGDGDEIDVVDDITCKVTLHLNDSVCDEYGASTTFDDPWAAGAEYEESWRSSFDADNIPATPPPAYPGPPSAVMWGFDKEWLCPADVLLREQCGTFDGTSTGKFDRSLRFDGTLDQVLSSTHLPSGYPAVYPVGVVAAAGTITRVLVQLNGPTGQPTSKTWELALLVDGSVVSTKVFDVGYTHPVLGLVVTMTSNLDVQWSQLVGVNAGASVAVRLTPASGGSATWTEVVPVVHVSGGAWKFDTVVPAGTYCSSGVLHV